MALERESMEYHFIYVDNYLGGCLDKIAKYTLNIVKYTLKVAKSTLKVAKSTLKMVLPGFPLRGHVRVNYLGKCVDNIV